jgi:outer membrane immunogenic protein
MKRSLLIAALFAGATVPAIAADLPVKSPPPMAPIMAPISYWDGFYIGINGGYSWGKAGRELTFFNPATGIVLIPPIGSSTTTDSNLNGGLFGGQIGYNWQSGSWVFGFETDAQWTNQKGTASALCGVIATVATACLPGVSLGTSVAVTQQLDWFGTFRGRAGVLVTPGVLLYGTGGAAYGSLTTDITVTTITPLGLPFAATRSGSNSKFGWTLGGGIEAMFGSNWSGKLEYLYMDLGTVTSTSGTGIGLVGANLSTRVTDNIFRAGINYHFSAGPVVARY